MTNDQAIAILTSQASVAHSNADALDIALSLMRDGYQSDLAKIQEANDAREIAEKAAEAAEEAAEAATQTSVEEAVAPLNEQIAEDTEKFGSVRTALMDETKTPEERNNNALVIIMGVIIFTVMVGVGFAGYSYGEKAQLANSQFNPAH